jgi:diaminohydroxyphosphoribosylaminopyrimidine deaminase/5-amino-6-(5-phosphoribosylamino)uracil reductase
MMRLALSAARRALGTTAPNPTVGAVIADEAAQTVIAVAATAPGGRPHAEPLAIAQAGALARGATMYVTLEPCSHVGKTPPCADAVIAAGLSRVVMAQEDPDPRVSGRGTRRLRDAGIKVDRCLLAAEADWLTRGHILRVTERRPFTQLKLAVSHDFTIARGGGGRPVWVTGEDARARGHLFRSSTDAILVGSRTVADDDPDLTCRLPGLSKRSPVRVVLAGKELPSLATRLVRTAALTPVWIMATRSLIGAHAEPVSELARAGCKVIEVSEVGGRPWLPAVAEALVAEGITRLLVEGGPRTWRAFAAAGLADEVIVFRAGANSPGPCASGKNVPDPGQLAPLLPGLSLRLTDLRQVGADTMLTYRQS